MPTARGRGDPVATPVGVTLCYCTVLEFNSHLLLQERKSEHNGRNLLTRRRGRIKCLSVITAMLLGSTENKENVHSSEFNVLPTVIITYLLTPWCRALLEKLTRLQLVKKFPTFHGTRRFITALTNRPPHFSILGQPNPVHIPTSHLLEIHPNIIHPSTPRSPQWSLQLRLPHQDPIHPPLLTHTRHMPSPSHSSRFYHPHNIGWGVQII